MLRRNWLRGAFMAPVAAAILPSKAVAAEILPPPVVKQVPIKAMVREIWCTMGSTTDVSMSWPEEIMRIKQHRGDA